MQLGGQPGSSVFANLKLVATQPSRSWNALASVRARLLVTSIMTQPRLRRRDRRRRLHGHDRDDGERVCGEVTGAYPA